MLEYSIFHNDIPVTSAAVLAINTIQSIYLFLCVDAFNLI